MSKVLTETESTKNPFTEYQFTDEHGHPLENCQTFLMLKKDIEFLTDTAAKYARSKSSINVMKRVSEIRGVWGLYKQAIG